MVSFVFEDLMKYELKCHVANRGVLVFCYSSLLYDERVDGLDTPCVHNDEFN